MFENNDLCETPDAIFPEISLCEIDFELNAGQSARVVVLRREPHSLQPLPNNNKKCIAWRPIGTIREDQERPSPGGLPARMIFHPKGVSSLKTLAINGSTKPMTWQERRR